MADTYIDIHDREPLSRPCIGQHILIELPVHADNDISLPNKTMDDTRSFTLRLPGKISSAYGYRRHPLTRKLTKHRGVDIPAAAGTKIFAPIDGKVTFVGWKTGYGNVITIDNGNGYTVLIAHNQKNLTKVGASVTSTSLIGTVGSTGLATGPHMHVEVIYKGEQINPKDFFP